MRKFWLAAFLCSLLVPALLFGGKLTLKDGTVLEGTIKKLGGSYSVKLADGSMKLIPGSDVASVDDPALTAASSGTTAGGKPGIATPGGGGDFDRTARQAERVDSPLVAVTIWQKFIDTHPAAADQAAGKKELDKWQDWAKKGAERVNGKWVVGDDLEKLQKDVEKLWAGYYRDMVGNKTVNSTKKLEDILKIYPNHFPANFELGYIYLMKSSTRVEGSNAETDKAIKSLETAVKIDPKSAEALSNLAIAYNFRQKYEQSAVTAFKAAQMKDTPQIVQNLISALSFAPPGMRTNNPKVKPIVDEARLLAARHNISAPKGWLYVRPRFGDRGVEDDDDGDGKGPSRKGMVGSGTGFFVSADGYIMTNKHVAGAADKLMVRLSDGTMRTAEKVVIDDEQDIAIIKIDQTKKVEYPFIKIAAYDTPNVGTDVTVMGFPLGAAMGMNVKITRGVVTSLEEDEKNPCDVIVDAQVNPGNSGGPMLDKYGNLLALVAMKTLADEKVSSYGLGISPKRLRKFITKQEEKLKPVKFIPAEKTAPTAALSTEEIAGKFTKATVMILMYSGEFPKD